jgi:hypothetical protein
VPFPVQTQLGSIALLGLLLSVPAHAQDPDREAVRALGAFDQIATQCARGGADSEIDAFRMKLWRAYLVGQGAADTSAEHIDEMIARLRSEMVNDVTNDLRRQYKSARAAIPDMTRQSPEEQREFYELCEAPRIRGAPP